MWRYSHLKFCSLFLLFYIHSLGIPPLSLKKQQVQQMHGFVGTYANVVWDTDSSHDRFKLSSTLAHKNPQVLHCHRPLKQFQRCQHYHHFPWFRHRSQLTNISLSLRKWCRTCTKEGHLKKNKNMFSIISGRKITFRVLLFLSHSWIKYSVQYSKTKLREAPY